MNVAAGYERWSTEPDSINEHLPVFVSLVLELNAQKVIELGVGGPADGGHSTVAWLYGLAQTGGHLWSVDLQDAPFEAAGWTFIQGNDQNPAILAALPGSVDIVFIDASHDYDETVNELELYGARVRPGGRIVLHDTASTPRGPKTSRSRRAYRQRTGNIYPHPVRYAADAYCTAYGYPVTYRDNCCGLGIIEVA